MNSKDFKQGDILLARHRELIKGRHPIVFIEGYSDTDFIGAMLTHSNYPNRNIKIDSILFEKQYGYENTYLVIGKFMKPDAWGPFRKVNSLTPEGISFVTALIKDQQLEAFSDYFKRLKL